MWGMLSVCKHGCSLPCLPSLYLSLCPAWVLVGDGPLVHLCQQALCLHMEIAHRDYTGNDIGAGIQSDANINFLHHL